MKKIIEKNLGEITLEKLPETILLDRTFEYVSPIDGEYDRPIIDPQKFIWKGPKELNTKIEVNAIIKNTGDLKYEDIFIDTVITVLNKDGKITTHMVIEWHTQTTGQKDEYTWPFLRGATIPSMGYLIIEFICKRVLSFNTVGSGPYKWKGNFDLINNSRIEISEQK